MSALVVDKQWIDDHCMSKRTTVSGDRKLISKWANPRLWRKLGLSAELEFVMSRGKPTIVECLHSIYHPERDGLCVECGNPCNFHTFAIGYHAYCSKQCAMHSKTRARRISATIKVSPKSAAARERIKQANIEKYGVPYYYQTYEFKQKAAKTKFDLHGDPYWNNSEAGEATCMERYGARSLMCLPEFQKRMQQIMLDKYGRAFPGSEVHSAGENNMRAAIELATGKAWPSNYGILPHGLELDGYCKELNAAFEYCGLFWHSSQYKHRMYHRMKLNECKKLGIRLFTVFEDEWLERGDQVVEFITASVGMFSESIGARKCALKVCEYSDPFFRDVNAFIAENHIQRSSSRSRMCIALLYRGSIVAAASFGPHPRNEGIVLNRLVFKPKTQVVGAISRIMKAADKFYDGKNIDTWSDSRWSEGNGYAKAGLKMTREYFVDYSYVKAGRRVTKQSMKKKDSGCPPGMTEREYCENVLGLYRLYDCGKKRWSTHRD